MFLNGPQPGTLHEARLVDIHGTRFYDLRFTLDRAPDQLRTARVGFEDVFANPQPGDQVQVRFLMNVVVGVERR